MFVSAQYGIRFALRYYAPPPNRFFQFPRFVRVIAPGPQPRRRFRRKTDRKTGRFSSRERNPHTKRANIRIISQNTKPKPLVLTFRARFSEKRFIGPADSAEKRDISSQHPCRSDRCSPPPAGPRKAASAKDFRSRHFEASDTLSDRSSRRIFGRQLFGRRLIDQTASRPAGPRSIAFQPTDPRPAVPRSTSSSVSRFPVDGPSIGSSSIGKLSAGGSLIDNSPIDRSVASRFSVGNSSVGRHHSPPRYTDNVSFLRC